MNNNPYFRYAGSGGDDDVDDADDDDDDDDNDDYAYDDEAGDDYKIGYTCSYNHWKKYGLLNIHSSIYFIKYNWEDWRFLRHSHNRIYLTSILSVLCLQVCLHNDDN